MIIMYTKIGCPWCDEVRELLQEKKIWFEEREVILNDKYFKELKDKSEQTRTPTFDIEGEIFVDLGREEAGEILKNKGLI